MWSCQTKESFASRSSKLLFRPNSWLVVLEHFSADILTSRDSTSRLLVRLHSEQESKSNIISHNLPLRYSIQFCTVSGGSVSLTCFNASSRRTSPVGESFLSRIFLPKRDRFLIPPFSSSTRPLNPSSINIQPRRPLDMQSFQNEV